jgi:hypothetical protein
MPDENDIPLTDEELARAREGEALIAAAVSEVRAPQALRESIERERERASSRARAPFWRRYRLSLALASAAAAALVVVVIALQNGESPGQPPLSKVVAAARLEPASSAPRSIGGTPPELDARVGDLVFPDWKAKFAGRPSAAATTRSRGATSPPSSIGTPTGRGWAMPWCPATSSPPGRPAARSHVTARRTT